VWQALLELEDLDSSHTDQTFCRPAELKNDKSKGVNCGSGISKSRASRAAIA